jgi:hypothetical protein
MNILPTSQWQPQRAARLARLRPVVEAHLQRASRHEKHPVIDFLFQYYSFRPSQLMTWSPGAGVVLEGDAECMISCGGRGSPSAKAEPRPPEWWSRTPNGWQVDVSAFPEKRRLGLEWVIHLLEAVQENAPRFGCHGLHEWAMVYKASEKQVRHYSFPLRLPMNEIEELVNSQPIQCTHYDAFRFFMPDARPLNRFQPQHTNRFDMEQSGCIHVNMDHYKWAYKYYPWISTDRVADAFELAIDARSVDMRASPYDLRSLGYEPILIETSTGREQYQAEQRRLQQAGSILRAALVKDLKHLLESIPVCA